MAQGVDRATVQTHLVVQMVAGGPARIAHVADDVSALDPLAGRNVESREVAVASGESVAVGEINGLTQATIALGLDDDAVGGCQNRLAGCGRNVYRLVERALAVKDSPR